MKPQCETVAQCLKELARVMEQFGINDIFEAVTSKYVYEHECIQWGYSLIPRFELPKYWRFAIAEVEGKPVFIGDELYDSYGRLVKAERVDKFSWNNSISLMADGRHYPIEEFSWNPPCPKTVMVELTVEDAADMTNSWSCGTVSDCYGFRISQACKKALEKLK